MPRFFICVSRAILSFAEKTNSFLEWTVDTSDSDSLSFKKGALSKTTWAFVPPNPKLLILAKRFSLGQGRWLTGTYSSLVPMDFESSICAHLEMPFGERNLLIRFLEVVIW
jgi:hypothetical protein